MNTSKEIFFFLLFTTGLLLVALAGTALAQEGDVDAVLQKAQESGLDKATLVELQQRASSQGATGEQITSLIQPAIDMAEQSLPAEVALEKALEGLSKGVPASKIAPVLQRLNQTAAEAATIVDSWLKRPDVKRMITKTPNGITNEKFRNELTKATSKALNQNIDQETTKEILNAIGDESIMKKASTSDVIAAVGILPDMARGVDQSQAGKFLIRALKGGFKANELQNLPSAMSMARQRSELPAASVLERVSEQLDGEVPAKQILQNLFNGQVGGGPPGNIPKGLESRPDRGNQGNNGSNGNNGNSGNRGN